MTKIPHRSSKKQRIDLINQDIQTETNFLKEIYFKLAGENPALNLNQELSKAELLSGIAEVAKPVADPDVHFDVIASIYDKLAGGEYSGEETTADILLAIADLELGGGSSLTIVQNIPTTLLPGQKVWCVATQSEWIGADPDNGIFPTLAIGTPWPAKGYKAISGHAYYKLSDSSDQLVIFTNDLGSFTANMYSDPARHFLEFPDLTFDPAKTIGFMSNGTNNLVDPGNLQFGFFFTGASQINHSPQNKRLYLFNGNAGEEAYYYFFEIKVFP